MRAFDFPLEKLLLVKFLWLIQIVSGFKLSSSSSSLNKLLQKDQRWLAELIEWKNLKKPKFEQIFLREVENNMMN